MQVADICKQIQKRLEQVHITCFQGREKPLLLISEQYPGVWLEHVYDAVFYATQDPGKIYLAENTVDLFMEYQTPDGQFPCYVWDTRRVSAPPIGYAQLQECVSFARMCLLVYRLDGDKARLQRAYDACTRWVFWLKAHRMTTGRGLVEQFVGYDTGHDESGRLQGLSCPGNYKIDGVGQNAAVLPPHDPVAPLLAVDINCNFYGTLSSLGEMARLLGLGEDIAAGWEREAAGVKTALFAHCYNEEDCFFYDVDRQGRQRKYRSSTIFHLFLEEVLDPAEDAALIRAIYARHLSDPQEFATPYPYPSMALNDPSCQGHATHNCWGYYSQGLIALRATLWMERYGFVQEFQHLCHAWVSAWTAHFSTWKLGQELDPVTGVPTRSSEWYSSTMLFYLYAARRLGLWQG